MNIFRYNKWNFRSKHQNNSGGFTIVEMMIATAVFATVLLLCSTAIVQVGRMFYKGVTINRVQDTSRLIVDDIAQSIQFGDTSNPFYQTAVSGSTQLVCLGRIRYAFNRGVSLGTAGGQSTHVLWKDRIGANASCNSAVPVLGIVLPSVDGIELLGTNMRVPVFCISSPTAPGVCNPPSIAGKIYLITITIAYGDTADLFSDATYTQCIRRDLGGQFCAVSNITTSVLKRL